MNTKIKRIAIIGAGPSGLFALKRLIDSGRNDMELAIFEKKEQLGAGMPYSTEGANKEHITNVSANEIPHLVTSVKEWLHTCTPEFLAHFNIDLPKFHEYHVFPRLLFGAYLSAQFDLLLENAHNLGIPVKVYFNTLIIDMVDEEKQSEVFIKLASNKILSFDYVIICTGHYWPVTNEGKIPGYYDSPYPPAKLNGNYNHPIALKGSSLTAIDAIRTLSRHHGTFKKDQKGKLYFTLSKQNPLFKMIMHSRSGLLPAVRFHLENSHLTNNSLLTPEEIAKNISENNGFLSIDFVFEQDFKRLIKKKDPAFYNRIKNMNLELFVDFIMNHREQKDPFELLKIEYEEAQQSIEQEKSIYWKEMLAILSFAMNYPAKYFSAEDMQRLQKELKPLISIVIAFVPQSSCEELLALHDAGILEIISVGDDNKIEPVASGGVIYHYMDEHDKTKQIHYKTFINCVGQEHLSYDEFPFGSLRSDKKISRARLKYKSKGIGKKEYTNGNRKVEKEADGSYYLTVPGISINDHFQIVDPNENPNNRIYMMAVPYIGGFNPDYSGLDFCAEASKLIVNNIFGKKKDEVVDTYINVFTQAK